MVIWSSVVTFSQMQFARGYLEKFYSCNTTMLVLVLVFGGRDERPPKKMP